MREEEEETPSASSLKVCDVGFQLWARARVGQAAVEAGLSQMGSPSLVSAVVERSGSEGSSLRSVEGRKNIKRMDATVTSLSDLPDEVLQICFARLPLEYLPRIRVVCKRWHKLGDPHFLRRTRKSLGLTQTCTFVLDNEYIAGKYRGLQGRAIDSQSHKVHAIATLESPHRLQYGAAGADGLLYILGGRSPLTCQMSPKAWTVYSRVDVFEPLSNSWYEMRPMRIARYSFAAGAFVDLDTRTLKLIVAGGYDSEGEALHSADVYDFIKERWEAIPSMSAVCGPCKGEVFEGTFRVQQANGGLDCMEIYDTSSCRWAVYNPKVSEFCPKANMETCWTCKSITLDL